MARMEFTQNNLYVVLDWSQDHPVRLMHLSALPFEPERVEKDSARWYNLAELSAAGEGTLEHHGLKHFSLCPSQRLRYSDMADARNAYGRKLEITQRDDALGLTVVSHLQFFDGVPAIQSWTEVINGSDLPLCLDYVSSFSLAGLAKESAGYENLVVHTVKNSWCDEAQWRAATPDAWGVAPVNTMSTQRVSVSNEGAWSCLGHLPMGAVENPKNGSILLWQIEHNGSWQWEISDISRRDLYLKLSGPTEQESGWYRELLPGERFETVRASLVACQGTLETAIRQMTRYRRATRRACADNRELPLVFNDYLLFDGNATAKGLEPMIDLAAELGCEIFCMDCGWNTDGWWWSGVGDWRASAKNFPNGLEEPLERIRRRGMKAGLWLELEVMGQELELAKRLPDDWFFQRHAKRVADHGRYQLDFTNPEVRAFADEVVDRMVGMGFEYLKLDYNIESGLGTQAGNAGLGDGLLRHNLAVLSFLDGVLRRHPNLTVESVASGGLRMDWATVSRSALESCTDQTERDMLAAVALASVSALTPEQCGVWCLPFPGTIQEAAFSLTASMLLRPCISGDPSLFTGENLELVKRAVACYKRIRRDIPQGLPLYPLGIPRIMDDAAVFGLELENKAYYTVLRMRGAGPLTVPLRGPARGVQVLFPPQAPDVSPEAGGRALHVARMNAWDAALIEVTY